MGQEWREMTDAQKQKFKDLEASDRKNKKASAPGSKKAKPKYEGPKRPTSAFFFFQEERRPQLKELHPDKSHKEIVSVSTLTFRCLDRSGEN